MTHKSFSLKDCIAAPVQAFMKTVYGQGSTRNPALDGGTLFLPEFMFIPPPRIISHLIDLGQMAKQKK